MISDRLPSKSVYTRLHREEAMKRRNFSLALTSYERISNAGLVTPDHKISIVLLTEYTNMS